MGGIVVSILLVITLIVIPSYLLSSFSPFVRYSSIIERIFFGLVLTMSVFILVGFILSYFNMFKPFHALILLIAYNIIIFVLYFKYYNENMDSIKLKSKKIDKVNIAMLFLFIVIIFIFFIHTQSSPFLPGYDQGKHFGRTVYVINNHHLPTYYLGTNYNPFYFEGPNIILSTLVEASTALSNLNPNIEIYDFNFLIDLGYTFKLFFVFLLSLNLFAIYFISNRIYNNKKINLMSMLIFVTICGISISIAGSIGTILGIIFLSVFIIYLNAFLENHINKVDYIFLFLIIAAIIFTHVNAIALMCILTIFIAFWKYIKRELKIKNLMKTLIFVLSCAIISIIFLFFLNGPLFYGIIEEVIRKTTQENNIYSRILDSTTISEYFSQNVSYLLIRKETIFISSFFFIFGFFVDIKYKQSLAIPIAFSSFAFVIFPISPFLKIMDFLLYPISIMGGLGLFFVFKKIKENISFDKITKKILVITIISLIAICGIISSSSISLEQGINRARYYDCNTYKEAYDLVNWLNKNLDSSHILLFPGSGPSAYIVDAFSSNKVLFAEPRFSDLPSFQETSKIYLKYPTDKGIFDFSNITAEEKHNILIKYKISAIVTKIDNIDVDIESIKVYYSKVEIYQPTLSYCVIIVGDKL